MNRLDPLRGRLYTGERVTVAIDGRNRRGVVVAQLRTRWLVELAGSTVVRLDPDDVDAVARYIEVPDGRLRRRDPAPSTLGMCPRCRQRVMWCRGPIPDIADGWGWWHWSPPDVYRTCPARRTRRVAVPAHIGRGW